MIAVIINPSAGRARRVPVHERAGLAAAIIERHGHRAEVFVTERPGHASDFAKAAAARGARLVVAWGGDGTINDVASALAFGQQAAMGIIPAGSGNGLARALGIHTDPARALADAVTAPPRRIDVGELAGRLFVNVAGIGFDAHVAARFNRPGNPTRGLAGYALSTARGLISYSPRHYEIVAAGRRRSVRALFVAVANGTEFGNQIRIAPGASVDDGVLDLVVVEERSRLTTIWNMRRLLTNSIEAAPIWSCERVRDATIKSDAPMAFHVDGEPAAGGTELQVRIHPAALQVCVRPR